VSFADGRPRTRKNARVTPIPGPPEDPYSSLEHVQHLDRMLQNLHGLIERIARNPGAADERSTIRQAAMELLPAASSIASSIRTMIREGYLVSALFRPPVERIDREISGGLR
jgi:hypothetical protein